MEDSKERGTSVKVMARDGDNGGTYKRGRIAYPLPHRRPLSGIQGLGCTARINCAVGGKTHKSEWRGHVAVTDWVCRGGTVSRIRLVDLPRDSRQWEWAQARACESVEGLFSIWGHRGAGGVRFGLGDSVSACKGEQVNEAHKLESDAITAGQ